MQEETTEGLIEELQEAVSEFRKATFEFAQSMNPADHRRMLDWQVIIFEIARSGFSK